MINTTKWSAASAVLTILSAIAGCSSDAVHGAGGSSATSSGTTSTSSGGEGAALCSAGFADCDGKAETGCEAALRTSVANCGACGHACTAPASATALCSQGACTFVCDAGKADCDAEAENGCEIDLTTDAKNCGACGVACTSTCTDGTCDVTVIADGQSLPLDLAVDDTAVYWIDYGTPSSSDGAVLRADKAGGSATTMASMQEGPHGLMLDDTYVYWVTNDGAVRRVPKAGGDATTLATGQTAPIATAIAAGHLLWVNAGTPPAGTDSAVVALDLSDPTAMPVVVAPIPGRLSSIAVASDGVYATLYGTGRAPDGALWRLGSGASQPTLLGGNLPSPRALISGAGGVWFAATGAIMTSAAGSTSPPTAIIPEATQQPYALAVDATRIWWTTAQNLDGAVMSARLDGTDLRVRARNVETPTGIAVDDGFVYWTSAATMGDPDSGRIFRAPK